MDTLPGTEPFVLDADPAVAMVAGIHAFLLRETAIAMEQPLTGDPLARRERLMRIIGAVDSRPQPVTMELIAPFGRFATVAETSTYTVQVVRWEALASVHGEGLLLQPKASIAANVIALPDCDWSPEMLAGLTEGVAPESQYALRLVESGCRVLIPVLIDRRDTWSGHPDICFTNEPHREFVYRMAFEMGRHIIGYEVQKVLAAMDWFTSVYPELPIGVIGYAEGGLIALHSAAIDSRVNVVCVSGYFGPRETLYQEPIYRNVFGLLPQFRDAGLASLIAPRPLIIEAARVPAIDGPPPPRDGRAGAAPGRLWTPALADVQAEVERARLHYASVGATDSLAFVASEDGNGPPGSEATLTAFLQALAGKPLTSVRSVPLSLIDLQDPDSRMKRQFEELCLYTQVLLRRSHHVRAKLWEKADSSSLERWQATTHQYRNMLWDEVIGRFPSPTEPANPRTRLIYDEPTWRGYEVMLDVWPEVFAYGILLLPKDLGEGERRPVVVCQHGLEGRPQKTIDAGDAAYNSYAVKLVERGFIVYAPQNPYIGGDDFRVLQRLANPLGKSLFAVIVRQHERTLEWLAQQSFVDPQRIAFYGISYGGKTAMRVPALLEQYCLSICSANFNEWVLKNASWEDRFSYMYTGEYEMFEFNLGHTFNYAEMAFLIAPRPFMVERGHNDGVGVDEWIAYEYAKVRRLYDTLGIPDRTEIEFFNGGHMINGQGTFDFLHKHLNWPK
ncbi:MAG: alpha/beta hydrolase family protein [Candidatus Zipacnadales bacterium]